MVETHEVISRSAQLGRKPRKGNNKNFVGGENVSGIIQCEGSACGEYFPEEEIKYDQNVAYCENCYESNYCDFGIHVKSENDSFIDCGDYGMVCSTCVEDSDLFHTPDHIIEESDWEFSNDRD